MLKFHYIILITVPLIDQLLKYLSSKVIPNPGLAFSFFINQPVFINTVILCTGFLVLLTAYIYSMYLLVKPVPFLRFGSSIFVAGAFSNCLDRLWFHYVRDHFTFDGQFFFNFADMTIWPGLLITVGSLFYYRTDIWRENCLRKTVVFLNSSHFMLTQNLLGITLVPCISMILFNLSFIRFMNFGSSALHTYLWLAIAFNFLTLVLTLLLILIYTQRIVGPLQALKRHLQGECQQSDFLLRRGDPLVELKEIASIIKGFEEK